MSSEDDSSATEHNDDYIEGGEGTGQDIDSNFAIVGNTYYIANEDCYSDGNCTNKIISLSFNDNNTITFEDINRSDGSALESGTDSYTREATTLNVADGSDFTNATIVELEKSFINGIEVSVTDKNENNETETMKEFLFNNQSDAEAYAEKMNSNEENSISHGNIEQSIPSEFDFSNKIYYISYKDCDGSSCEVFVETLTFGTSDINVTETYRSSGGEFQTNLTTYVQNLNILTVTPNNIDNTDTSEFQIRLDKLFDNGLEVTILEAEEDENKMFLFTNENDVNSYRDTLLNL